MKLALLRLAAITWMLLILGCGKDEPTPGPAPVEKTPEQLALEQLSGTGSRTWILSGGGMVQRGNTDVTALYTGFELTVNSGSSKTYAIRNGNELFDTSGNWSFAGSNFDKITFTGSKPAAGREISFTQTGDNLRLEFTVTDPNGRTFGAQALAGNYIFNLIKK